MKHARKDYNAIQPWPTKREHYIKDETNETEKFEASDRLTRSAIDNEVIFPIIPDDEPVFLLRSKDKFAPGIVRDWAIAVHAGGGDPDLVEAVDRFADEMEEYATEHYDGGKVPDAPEGSLS